MTAPLPHLPHHDGSPLHVSSSAPSLGERVALRLRVPTAFLESVGGLKAVTVRSTPDGEPAWDAARPLGTVGGWQWWQAEVTVHNPRHRYRWLLRTGAGEVLWLNQAGLERLEGRDVDDFALLAAPTSPDWLAASVMYQIVPDRFARSAAADARAAPDWAEPAAWHDPVDPVMPSRVQQFYGGDLDGVVEKLDHLEALGVDLLYLTPFFPAASNHRYDATTFEQVDPLLGGDEALARLTAAAHARGMRVIGDLTTNHTGDGHEWFRTARADPDSAEREFYLFDDDGADGGERGSGYESWLGTPTLPKLDWSSAELRRRFIDGPDSVVGRWLRPPAALDGWRIDVASMTGRLREVDLNAEVRQILRRTMDRVAPGTALLAESTNDATEDLTGDAWHGAMTYVLVTRPLWSWLCAPDGVPHTTADGGTSSEPWFFGQPLGGIPSGTAADFAASVTQFSAGIPWRIRLGTMQPLNTHDTARFATHAAEGTVPVALGLMMTLPGVPMLFAGDEFGLTGADGELSRTPMPWGLEHRDPAAAERLALCRELVGLRRRHPVLAAGGMRWVHVDDDAVVFLRESAEESVLVLACSAATALEIPQEALPGLDPAGDADDAVERLHGSVRLVSGSGSVHLSAEGPACGIWRLAGVPVPE